MNLSAHLIGDVVGRRSSLPYATQLTHAVTPGQSIHLANGEVCRVLAKTASENGVCIRIARKHGPEILTIRQLAQLHPVSGQMRRIANFVHRVLSYDSSLSDYVNAAIEKSGLPLDPSMNWGKWLTAVYRPRLSKYTSDESLLDEAIREVVLNTLYDRNLLETSFDKDNPSLAGKPLDKKVSAYLSFIFKKNVSYAVEYIQRMHGIGALGELGKTAPDSLYLQDDEDSTEDRNRALSTDDGEDERLSAEEVHSFLDSFKEWCGKTQRSTSADVLNFITDRVEQGDPRKEIRDDLVASHLRGRDGQAYNNETFKMMMSTWARLMKSFSSSSNNEFSDTSIAKAIADRVSQGAGKVTAASLVLAMDDTGKDPQEPYSSNTNPTTVIEPPKVNPNVQQQQNSLQNKGQTSPQEAKIQQGEDDVQQPQQRMTIPPEIPGVNHV